ncbi:MAG: hypothetical protein VCB42_02710 [Myxococcota bacterium]
MQAKTGPDAPVGEGQEAEEAGIACDFCGERVASVQRVALDGDYERLRTPHRLQYACPRCSERKERSRLGLERG